MDNPMELIIISDTKLKVMLSADDMEKYEFNPLDSGDITSRKAFRKILKEVRARCGFDAIGDRVFVQYYPSKRGGCEMFVTKLTEAENDNCLERKSGRYKNKESAERSFAVNNMSAYRRYGSENILQSKYIVYLFNEMECLLRTCAMLKTSDYKGESLAYLEEGKKKYYLALEEENYFAAENNGMLCNRAYYYFVKEHCKLICDDSVNILGDFA